MAQAGRRGCGSANRSTGAHPVVAPAPQLSSAATRRGWIWGEPLAVGVIVTPERRTFHNRRSPAASAALKPIG